TGVFELSLSFPAKIRELVAGKYLAALTLLICALLLTLPVPLTALYLGEPDKGAIFCGYLGALLLGSVYLAASCFASALSKSQTAGFLFSLVICAFFLVAGMPAVTDALVPYAPQWLMNALSFASFLPHYQTFQRGILDTGDIIYTVTATLFFLYLCTLTLEFASAGTGNIFAPGALSERSTRRAAKRFLLGFCAVFYVFICVNVIASTWKRKADLSSDKAYSLSEDASYFAEKLQKKVSLRLYASRKNPRTPQGVKRYAERIQWLLQDLADVSRGMISLEVLDPEADSNDEDAAAAEGVEAVRLASGDRIYLGISVSHAGKNAVVPFLAQEQENLLEYSVVRAILDVVREKKPKVGVMSAFNVLGTDMKELGKAVTFSGDKVFKPEPPWYVFSVLKESYDLVPVPLNAEKIPEDISALIVLHPAGIRPHTVYALDQYLLKGGRMAIFLDPRSLYATAKMRQEYSYAEKISSDLPPLLKTWGVNYHPDIVAADILHAYRKVHVDRAVTNPAVMLLQNRSLSRKDTVTTPLNLIMLCFASPLPSSPVSGINCEVLASTSRNSQTISAFIADRPDVILRNFAPGGQNLPLLLKLSGSFRTAFPEGSPSGVNKQHLKHSTGKPLVFLAGDSDMLFNDVCVRRSADAYGRMSIVRQNDNTAFLQAVVEQLVSEGNWLSRIRSRLPMTRPLTRYNEMKAKAELAYKERIRHLESSLRESTRKVELIRKAAELAGGVQRLSSSQRQDIARHDQKIEQAKRELREITRKLHADMAKIDTLLRLINLLFVPGAVLLLALGWSFIRFSKKRRRK
ncbi:MAG: Gldg family protein, partial [Lentisphaeria bacterium]|nr:Gldg family protein [Lentisphaeria bacterium]